MLIVEPGHIYSLAWLDGRPQGTEHHLIFVNREGGGRGPTNANHPGTQTQEVLRALIDRTMHCDNCLRWPGNDKIIYHLRAALVLHEARALERTAESAYDLEAVELIPTGRDGHFLQGPAQKGYTPASADNKRYHDARLDEGIL